MNSSGLPKGTVTIQAWVVTDYKILRCRLPGKPGKRHFQIRYTVLLVTFKFKFSSIGHNRTALSNSNSVLLVTTEQYNIHTVYNNNTHGWVSDCACECTLSQFPGKCSGKHIQFPMCVGGERCSGKVYCRSAERTSPKIYIYIYIYLLLFA